MPFYLQLLQTALSAELMAILPIIGVLLVVGLATAILQAVLQFEDTAFSLAPKTIVMILIALGGGWGMLAAFENLAVLWISHAGSYITRPWS